MVYPPPPGGSAPRSPNDGSKSKPSRSHLFAALGGFIGGVVASVAVVAIFGVGSPSRATGTPTPGTPGSAAPPAPAAPAAPASPGPPLPDVVLHQGPVTLAKGNGIDLDSTAGSWGEVGSSSLNDLELTLGGTSIDYPPGDSHFVQVGQSAPISYATCAAATGYVPSFDGPGEAANEVNTSLRFCVLTTQHRFSFVEVTAAPYDPQLGVPYFDSITVKVTTWARPAP